MSVFETKQIVFVKRLLVIAALFGAIGEFVESIRGYLTPQFGEGISKVAFQAAVLFVFTSIFAVCVCITLGVAKKSASLITRGTIAGIIAAFLYVFIRIVFEPPRLISTLILMVSLGLFAAAILLEGQVWSRRAIQVYFAGITGGAISLGLSQVAMFVTAIIAASLRFVFSSAPDYFVLYFFAPSLQGAFKAITIWLFVAIAARRTAMILN